jgi:hypothetical protein
MSAPADEVSRARNDGRTSERRQIARTGRNCTVPTSGLSDAGGDPLPDSFPVSVGYPGSQLALHLGIDPGERNGADRDPERCAFGCGSPSVGFGARQLTLSKALAGPKPASQAFSSALARRRSPRRSLCRRVQQVLQFIALPSEGTERPQASGHRKSWAGGVAWWSIADRPPTQRCDWSCV